MDNILNETNKRTLVKELGDPGGHEPTLLPYYYVID